MTELVYEPASSTPEESRRWEHRVRRTCVVCWADRQEVDRSRAPRTTGFVRWLGGRVRRRRRTAPRLADAQVLEPDRHGGRSRATERCAGSAGTPGSST